MPPAYDIHPEFGYLCRTESSAGAARCCCLDPGRNGDRRHNHGYPAGQAAETEAVRAMRS